MLCKKMLKHVFEGFQCCQIAVAKVVVTFCDHFHPHGLVDSCISEVQHEQHSKLVSTSAKSADPSFRIGVLLPIVTLKKHAFSTPSNSPLRLSFWGAPGGASWALFGAVLVGLSGLEKHNFCKGT